jgi:hypothetical protein
MFFITFYATIAPFLIRTRVKYPDQIFLNLAQYFRMDERTIVPILSKFRHFSMLLQFILKGPYKRVSYAIFYYTCTTTENYNKKK